MATPLTLPIARLRALGCKISTTTSHNGHDYKPGKTFPYFWEYVITLPEGVRVPIEARTVYNKATLRTTVQSNALVAYSYDRDSLASLLSLLADTIEKG